MRPRLTGAGTATAGNPGLLVRRQHISRSAVPLQARSHHDERAFLPLSGRHNGSPEAPRVMRRFQRRGRFLCSPVSRSDSTMGTERSRRRDRHPSAAPHLAGCAIRTVAVKGPVRRYVRRCQTRSPAEARQERLRQLDPSAPDVAGGVRSPTRIRPQRCPSQATVSKAMSRARPHPPRGRR